MSSHEVSAGNIQLYKRPKGRFWQCSASVGGKQRRASTKQESLSLAREFAEDYRIKTVLKTYSGFVPHPIKVGDQVELGEIRGELLETDGERATIGRGGLRIEVSASRLRRAPMALCLCR